jgi:hypothetical protein
MPTLQNLTQLSNPLTTNRSSLYSLQSDAIENTVLSNIVVLPSNELYHGSLRTQFMSFRVRWNMYTVSLPSNGYMRHDIFTLSLESY